ncbi:MAG: glycerol-3-phosphate 1-O-acyltransferase PlsY [Lachnospiraceae bacterium]
MLVLYRIICILIGYIFGLFQTGYIYGKLKQVDIREYGSGNAGTTNAMRVLGKKAGIITYIGDMLKGVIAGCIVRLLCAYVFDIGTGDEFLSMEYILIMYAGLGVVLGHNYPFYMSFKGGKGIAASSGVIISLFYLPVMLIDLVTFVSVTAISKYVSLGSICLMTVHFVSVLIFVMTGCINAGNAGFPGEFLLLTFLFCALAIYKHRGNISRLIKGTERKIGEKKHI